MTALADVTDYQQILGISDADVAGDASVRIGRLLVLASASVLARAHGQRIIEGTDTAIVLRPQDGLVVFPQRPVTAIGPVIYQGQVIPAAGVDPSAFGYRWTPGGDGQQAFLVRVVNGFDRGWRDPVTVTYTHGWADIPEQIIAATVFTAQSALVQGDDQGGVVIADAIDDYQRTFQAGRPGLLPIPDWLADQIDTIVGLQGPTSVQAVRVM